MAHQNMKDIRETFRHVRSQFLDVTRRPFSPNQGGMVAWLCAEALEYRLSAYEGGDERFSELLDILGCLAYASRDINVPNRRSADELAEQINDMAQVCCTEPGVVVYTLLANIRNDVLLLVENPAFARKIVDAWLTSKPKPPVIDMFTCMLAVVSDTTNDKFDARIVGLLGE